MQITRTYCDRCEKEKTTEEEVFVPVILTINGEEVVKYGEVCPACKETFLVGAQKVVLSPDGTRAPLVELKSLEQASVDHLVRVLTHFDWNKTETARVLNVERSTVDRKLKKFKIERPKRSHTAS